MDNSTLHRIETKLDRLIEELGNTRTRAEVHAAVCDDDRKELKLAVERNTTKIWKILVAIVGAGAVGGGATELLKGMINGGQ